MVKREGKAAAVEAIEARGAASALVEARAWIEAERGKSRLAAVESRRSRIEAEAESSRGASSIEAQRASREAVKEARGQRSVERLWREVIDQSKDRERVESMLWDQQQSEGRTWSQSKYDREAERAAAQQVGWRSMTVDALESVEAAAVGVGRTFPTLAAASLVAVAVDTVAASLGKSEAVEDRRSVVESRSRVYGLARLIVAQRAPRMATGNGTMPRLMPRAEAEAEAARVRIRVSTVAAPWPLDAPMPATVGTLRTVTDAEAEAITHTIRSERTPGSMYGAWLDDLGDAPAQHGVPRAFAQSAPSVPEVEADSLRRSRIEDRISAVAIESDRALAFAALDAVEVTSRGGHQVDWDRVREVLAFGGREAGALVLAHRTTLHRRLAAVLVEAEAVEVEVEAASSESRTAAPPARHACGSACRGGRAHGAMLIESSARGANARGQSEREAHAFRVLVDAEREAEAIEAGPMRGERARWLAGAAQREAEAEAHAVTIEARLIERGHSEA